MSQKSSLPEAAKSVSQVLVADILYLFSEIYREIAIWAQDRAQEHRGRPSDEDAIYMREKRAMSNKVAADKVRDGDNDALPTSRFRRFGGIRRCCGANARPILTPTFKRSSTRSSHRASLRKCTSTRLLSSCGRCSGGGAASR